MVYLILDDGETYSALQGCKIVQIADDVEDVDSAIQDGQFETITEFR